MKTQHTVRIVALLEEMLKASATKDESEYALARLRGLVEHAEVNLGDLDLVLVTGETGTLEVR